VKTNRAQERQAVTRKPRRQHRRSPIFNAWLAIQQRGRVCERWRSFSNFYFDVGKRPTWRHLLIRDDPTGAFSPENSRWQVARPYMRRRAPDAVKRRR
jgi:hypothetical protein